MTELYGRGAKELTCEGCALLEARRKGDGWACQLRAASSRHGADWAACGRFRPRQE